MTESPAQTARRPLDPRWFQIGALSSLLGWGLLGLDFDLGGPQALVTVVTALGTQALGDRLAGRKIELKSAAITGLSLCLLLRTDHLALAALGALLAIASKFLIRLGGKHVFNPANFALAALVLTTDAVWVSAGQWGATAFLGFLVVCLGLLVVQRAARADVSLTFLAAYSGLLFGRAVWLGDPLTIPLHQLQSGALLLFTFFMISDPKTTPSSRAGRLLFALAVAFGTVLVQFELFRPNGLILSLVAASLATPLLDRLLPGPRYAWEHPRPGPLPERSFA
ncbi:MAG TPA: RnfABCDGE type electron transport complex subunit D [Thermoanaerobaculia bacterium]|nr:RnfABCDGE type electron transport complex subunit D [Thermoanaerobaculia bacterium]